MNKNYKVIANSILNGDFNKIELPTENLDAKKLTLEEISAIVKEEFGKVQDLNKKKLPKEMQFADADLANQVDFVEKLKLKEFFNK